MAVPIVVKVMSSLVEEEKLNIKIIMLRIFSERFSLLFIMLF